CIEVINQLNIRSIEAILDELSTFKGIRPVKPNQLHLTLKFLGEVAEKRLVEIEKELKMIKLPSFEIELLHMGFFPNERRPRVIWIGLSEGKSQLITLAREVDDRLSKIGFPKEKRKFSPHLTVGRIKKLYPDELQNIVDYVHSINTVGMEKEVVQSILFKKSTLTPHGAIYENLAEVVLKNRI
ncbi:MAG: RNA 2',3'-cyclic phosphodiesterase, partial [Candidatus Heimdallarchaeota archaeon]|nr:RNA 2',3'-cyclic phosphodiesterase [Candidatus Heimdallarchaeota archaeon]